VLKGQFTFFDAQNVAARPAHYPVVKPLFTFKNNGRWSALNVVASRKKSLFANPRGFLHAATSVWGPEALGCKPAEQKKANRTPHMQTQPPGSITNIMFACMNWPILAAD
jgi:hypothetical protein